MPDPTTNNDRHDIETESGHKTYKFQIPVTNGKHEIFVDLNPSELIEKVTIHIQGRHNDGDK